MTARTLSQRLDHWAMAFLITLAAMAPLSAFIGLAHTL